MNVSRRKSNAQGRFPTLRKGAAYRQTLAALLVDGARMAGIDPVAVAKVFHRHNIDAVFIGELVIGCLTGRVPGFGDDLYAKFQAHRRGR